MQVFVKAALALTMAVVCSVSFAHVSVTETNRYDDVKAVLKKVDQQFGTNNVLAVFDIDNTLLTTGESDLGGDIWYQWQRGKLPIKPTAHQKVSCLFNSAIPMLYQLLPMKPTEPDAQSLVQYLANHNQTMLALSARGPENFSSTERELHRNRFDFSQNALAPEGSAEPPIYHKTFNKRETIYMDGVALTSGAHKGKYLSYLLDQTGRTFKSIVFVDDGQHNIDAMKETFSAPEFSAVDVRLIHYTKVADDRIKKNGTVLTKKQADEMASEWEQLNATLDAIYPERTEGC